MITADEFASFGLNLVAEGATEVTLRCAASRIYYAAYHICQEHAELHCTKLQHDDKEGGAHAQLFQRLSENSKNQKLDVLLSALAQTGLKMKAIRVDADYKLKKDFKRNDALRCTSLFDEVKELCGEIAAAVAT